MRGRGWLGVLILFVAACAPKPTPLPPFLDEAAFPTEGVATAPFILQRALATFAKNDVQVEMVVEADALGQTILAATFTPLREGFHLYSHALPREGINGAGRPTRLDLPADIALEPLGQWSANQFTLEDLVEGYSRPFLIYPEGPVTLRLPVRLTAARAVKATVFITYMACSSDQQCLPPVMEEPVVITLPKP